HDGEGAGSSDASARRLRREPGVRPRLRLGPLTHASLRRRARRGAPPPDRPAGAAPTQLGAFRRKTSCWDIVVRAPALPAQSIPGGRFGRGAKPPSEFPSRDQSGELIGGLRLRPLGGSTPSAW